MGLIRSEHTDPLRVSVRDASPEFSGSDSPLLRLSAAATDREVALVNRASEAQLQFTSNVRSDLKRLRSLAGRALNRRLPRAAHSVRRLSAGPQNQGIGCPTTIWYTGENETPPTGYNGTLSFEVDSFEGSNAYLPYWFFHVDGPFASRLSFSGLRPGVRELLNRRSVGTAGRPRFMCAFINNPTEHRLRAIHAFRSLGEVDVFGRLTGHTISEKAVVARDYRFMLVFENDLYPGYVTEKLLDAWACGCVPIWWGLDPKCYFNVDAYLNLATSSSLAGLREQVELIERNRSHDLFAGQPLLNKAPEWGAPLKIIRQVVDLIQ